MTKKSFKDIYNERKTLPTPAQSFISEVADLTHRSEVTIKMWLLGKQTPDALTQEVIANHFHTDINSLFPVKA